MLDCSCGCCWLLFGWLGTVTGERREKKGKEDLLGFVVLVSTREVTHKASFCFDFVLLLAGQLLYMEPDVVTCVPLRLLRCEKDSTKPRHWPGFFLWF